VPLVVRMVVGRGWGQGPQHSQSLQSLFGHVPGLKVVMPATPRDAKGMMIASIQDNDPVIFIEHRWLHNTMDIVPEGWYEVPLGKARVVEIGDLLTIATFSYMLVEAIIAANSLKKVLGVAVELIDMRSVRPLDVNSVSLSVKKTGHLLVADTGHAFGSVASELITSVVETGFADLKSAPRRICSPDRAIGTSPSLSKDYYPSPMNIIDAIIAMCKLTVTTSEMSQLIALATQDKLHDIPYRNFKGPF